MTGILFDTPPLVAVGAIFLLALVGAVVLFRFLKATAVFKTVQGQASGALAGFLMIFGALDGTYMHLAPGSAEMEELRSTIAELQARLAEVDTEPWTFTGRVRTPEGSRPADVEVRVLPPAPLTLVNGGRDFRLEHVEVVSGVWPQLQLSAEGFYPETVLLESDDLELHPERKLAVIKAPVLLEPDPFAGSFQAAALGAIAPGIQGGTP